VSGENESGTGGIRAFQHILLFSLILILPGMQGALFGWMHFIVPLTVFFYVYKWENGFSFIVLGSVIATIASIVLGSFEIMIFSAALIPAGYTLAHSAFQSNSPSFSGFKASVILVTCWIVLLIGETIVTGVNPVSDFLGSLDSNIEQTLLYYRQSEAMAPETLELLEQSFFQMKTALPKVSAAILLSLALAIIWFTMLVGNRIVLKFAGYRPWADHKTWLLPDKLIWLLIAAAVVSMLPLGMIRIIGLNVLIVLSLIYFFQGFSIFVFFLHKWGVPLFLRFMLYGMMLFQSFGTVLLLVVGIGDVWLDLRRLKQKKLDSNNDT
jgi:uncharacterized protein YybS (DUF2232 family)